MEAIRKKKRYSWIVLAMILFCLLFWLMVVKAVFGHTVIHRCKYQVTFVAPHGDFEDYETITLTVNRPVDLKRITDNWLQAEDGADLDESGVVDFRDYALWAKGGE